MSTTFIMKSNGCIVFRKNGAEFSMTCLIKTPLTLKVTDFEEGIKDVIDKHLKCWGTIPSGTEVLWFDTDAKEKSHLCDLPEGFFTEWLVYCGLESGDVMIFKG